MSLTQSDLQQIEAIFDRKLEPVLGKLETLENDIKEIYDVISDLQRSSITDKDFRKRPASERILILHAEVVAAAKELGVKLPQS
jgi:hypothetical protein